MNPEQSPLVDLFPEDVTEGPVAKTANQQDHEDPWQYAGDDAEAPENPED